jgi:NAD(P)-dependent dehydrogenase (short-subunit alcohol dehydrogenase family)
MASNRMQRRAIPMGKDRSNSVWKLEERTIVLPGGSGMLGREVFKALIECGAKVAALVRDPSKAGFLKDEMAKGPGKGMILKADVLDKESLVESKERILGEFGEIYALLNFAGGNVPEATTSPERSFFQLEELALRYTIDLNLMGAILSCRVFGKAMAEKGEGVIVNVGSMAGFRPLTRTVAHSAAKAALANFTQWLAVHMAMEYSPGIRVNAIAPGFFHTKQNHYLLFDESTGGLTPRGKAILAHTPMGRFGSPEDLVGAVLWLLSPLSSFVTGAVIPVDRGFSAFSGV